MNARNDGGPAFPQMDAYVNAAGEKPVYVAQGGATVRDLFAGLALVGLIANPEPINARTAYEAAKCAFELADAMIAERAK